MHVPYSSLSKIPWLKPIVVATSIHPNTHVHHGFRLAAPLYVAVPDVAHSGVPVSLQVSAGCQRQGCARNCNSVPAKTSSRSSHATCCAAILAFHSLLRMSCRHLECTFLRGPGFIQHVHFQDLQLSQCFDILRCTTCILLSSISSICSSARRTRTIQLLNNLTLAHRLTSPRSPATKSTTEQSRTMWDKTAACAAVSTLVLHGLDIIDFKHSRLFA